MQHCLDNLIAPSLQKSIEENLGKTTLNKIEQRLFERYGISLLQAINDFYKLDSVFREFFGQGADGLELKFLGNIINMNQSKLSTDWVIIHDQFLAQIFLESFADTDKKSILEATMEQPLMISDILDYCKIPQTSGYRKVHYLIDNGLIISNGYHILADGKKIQKYQAIFKKVQIDLIKKNITIKVQLKNNLMNESTILKVIQS
jgi:hypothetical protein